MTDILIHGIIGTHVRSKRVLEELKAAKDPVIRINSKGGDLFEGIAIFNAINSDGRNIPIIIEGAAFSAGAVIALAGKPIRMLENAMFMLHGVSSRVDATKEELKNALIVIEKAQDNLVKTLVARTNKSQQEIELMLTRDSYFTAQEALINRLIDEIVPVNRRSFFNIQELEEFSDMPVEILNYAKSFNSKRKSSMALRDVAAKLKLEFKEDEDDANLENLILEQFSNLQSQIQSRSQGDDDDDDDGDDDDDEGFGNSVPMGFMNMARNYRTSAIEAVMSDGKITASVADELKRKYCSDSILKKALLNKTSEDEFENVLSILRKNDKVVNLKGRSGVQYLPKEDDSVKGLLSKRIEARYAK